MQPSTIHPYYAARRPMIDADCRESVVAVSADIAALQPSLNIEALASACLAELDQLYPLLPYVGGAGARMTPFFEQGAVVIALGRVLNGLGIDTAHVASMMRKAFLARLSRLPDDERLALGHKFLSDENQQYIREMATRSHDKAFDGDFLYRYVAPGTGDDFAFGVDYLECGFCKLCRASGDEALLPHLCAIDQEFYALRGIRLSRSTTLASGADRCNFRFYPNAAKPLPPR